MKTYQVTKREGEHLGPVDWTYNFLPHFDCCATDAKGKQERCDAQVAILRKLCDGGKWRATTYGGWPRCGWGEVLEVGMYDGGPYWRPVPSVLIRSSWSGGAEWATFCSITDIEPMKEEVKP